MKNLISNYWVFPIVLLFYSCPAGETQPKYQKIETEVIRTDEATMVIKALDTVYYYPYEVFLTKIAPERRKAIETYLAPKEEDLLAIRCTKLTGSGKSTVYGCLCGSTKEPACMNKFNAKGCHLEPGSGQAACMVDLSDEYKKN